MKNKKYNGWTNYETWVCFINLTNNYSIAKLVESWVQQLNEKELENQLKVYVLNLEKISKIINVETNEICRIIKDIGNINKVNFKEIANSMKEK